MYSPNFSAENKVFCLSLDYNDDNSYLFVNGKEVTKLKVKKSEIKANQLTLGSTSTSANLSSSDIEDSKLHGNVYDFSAISNDRIQDIHAYLMKKNGIVYMFKFIKKCFFTAMTFFNLSNVNSLECVSMNNQECKITTEIINLNNNEPIFYPYSIKINRCKGSCNTINYPNAKMCVPDQIKNTNVKVFNLMSRTNETRHIKWHKTFKCKCRLDTSICNNKQRWNEDKCRCEC